MANRCPFLDNSRYIAIFATYLEIKVFLRVRKFI